MKVSYSTTHNMQKIISIKNAKTLNQRKFSEKTCNCRQNSFAPYKVNAQKKCDLQTEKQTHTLETLQLNAKAE